MGEVDESRKKAFDGKAVSFIDVVEASYVADLPRVGAGNIDDCPENPPDTFPAVKTLLVRLQSDGPQPRFSALSPVGVTKNWF